VTGSTGSSWPAEEPAKPTPAPATSTTWRDVTRAFASLLSHQLSETPDLSALKANLDYSASTRQLRFIAHGVSFDGRTVLSVNYSEPIRPKTSSDSEAPNTISPGAKSSPPGDRSSPAGT
jgi:hypothetical protein